MTTKKDEFHIHGTSPDGFVGTRKTNEGETEGVLTPMINGRPLSPGMEVVQIRPQNGNKSVLDMRSFYKIKGPPQVATPEYRKNYDRVFSNSQHDIN